MLKIDSLIKVWWSLISKDDSFKRLVLTLEDIAKEKNIVLTTWSKDISDIIRDRLNEILDIKLSVENHIDITWKSRDIVSKSFCDLNDRLIPIYELNEIQWVLKRWEIPVIIQYEILKKLQPFPLVRWLSTDTTSAFFANEIWTRKFIKLTNVDWVYSNLEDKTTLISELQIDELKKMWKTCICNALAWYLEKINSICYVMNGNNIENLKKFFDNWTWVNTKITS